MTDVSQDKLMPEYEPMLFEHPVGKDLAEWRENVSKTELYQRGDTVLIWVNEGDICDPPFVRRWVSRPPTDVSTDGLVAEWKRLEDAFHDNLPSQGECGDPSHGKALCQFLYDNSEKIRASLAALERRIAELEGETHKALEWALGVAAGVVEMGDPGYEHACDVFEQLDRKALSHSSETPDDR